ncbi:unnamed protein product, partial [Protopolystoma xenopodis]
MISELHLRLLHECPPLTNLSLEEVASTSAGKVSSTPVLSPTSRGAATELDRPDVSIANSSSMASTHTLIASSGAGKAFSSSTWTTPLKLRPGLSHQHNLKQHQILHPPITSTPAHGVTSGSSLLGKHQDLTSSRSGKVDSIMNEHLELIRVLHDTRSFLVLLPSRELQAHYFEASTQEDRDKY